MNNTQQNIADESKTLQLRQPEFVDILYRIIMYSTSLLKELESNVDLCDTADTHSKDEKEQLKNWRLYMASSCARLTTFTCAQGK